MTGSTALAWAAGMLSFGWELRRATFRLAEFLAALEASRAEHHADWYCALPAWKRILWLLAHGAHLTAP